MTDRGRIDTAKSLYTVMLEGLARYGSDPIAMAKRSAMRVVMAPLLDHFVPEEYLKGSSEGWHDEYGRERG